MSGATKDEWAQGRAIVEAMEGARANARVPWLLRLARKLCGRWLGHRSIHSQWERGDTFVGRGWRRTTYCLRCGATWGEWTTVRPRRTPPASDPSNPEEPRE